MIEVFKTNISEPSQARKLINILRGHFPEFIIHVDLHDCDKVLRVQGENFTVETILRLVRAEGHECVILE